MSGTMSQADLVADLKASLQDSANMFTAAADADFIRHLDAAAEDFSRARKRTMVGSLTLVAEQDLYPAPSDCLRPKFSTWGRDARRKYLPWDKNWTGRFPRMTMTEQSGAREILLSPAPTATQITRYGSSYKYFYFAAHAVDALAANTTIMAGDRALLLLRAQAEAAKELAMRNITKPVQLRDTTSSMPRNGTPAALYEALMALFEKQGGLIAA